MFDLLTAKKFDQEDTLANFKNQFENNTNEIYLDGNSLGKLPLKTKKICFRFSNHRFVFF